MNTQLRFFSLMALSGALLSSVSCVTSPPIHANVEELERQAPVSDLPNTGDTEYIHAAERYSNPDSYRNPYSGYRGGYGFGYRGY